MKKLSFTIAVVFIITTASAQLKGIGQTIPDNVDLSADLDLEKIKGHLKSGKICYDFHLASTAVVPPKTGGVRLVPIIGHMTTSRITQRNDHLVLEDKFLKNTQGFTRGDDYTVFIAPDRRDKKKINPLGVYITWRLPGESLRTFQLKDVQILYKPYGIMIVGNYDYDGILIGVSMNLTPNACLI